MRPRRREFDLVVIAHVIAVLAVFTARAEGPLGISEIRLVSAEEPTDEAADIQSTLAFTGDEQAPPAPPAAVPPAAKVVDAEPRKRPVKSRPFRRPAAVTTRAQIEPPVATNQIRHALNFYGGNQARATLSRFPSRTPIQAGPQQPMQRQLKPFQTIYRDPTVSPYMNLYREENDSQGAPNYFAFVRPELEQIETNRAQHRELDQLSRQMQGRGRKPTQQQYQPTGTAGRSTPARYMDTAQFYGGWAR